MTTKGGYNQQSLWSDADLATLRRLWLEGYTSRAIGDVLGRTRNAVLGCVHRHNMNDRVRATPQKPINMAPKPPKPKAPPKKSSEQPPVLAMPTVKREYTGARPWITRQSFECKFPVSGAGADTMSCCKPTRLLYGYCKEHEAVVYLPQKARIRVPRGV
jgi:hypothetical protein